MSTERDLVTFGPPDNQLVGSFHAPQAQAGYPLVILATGDGPSGSKGLTWQNLVPLLSDRGIGSFLFDFAGLGYSPGERRELTLSSGMRDFATVMDFVATHREHDDQRVGIIGASYGGNIALLASAGYPQLKAIGLKSPCCILAEAYQSEYGAELMARWGEAEYLDETEMNYGALIDSLYWNTYEAASRIQVPVRIVHGTADSAVPIRQSRDLVRVVSSASIFEIEGADHWYAENDEWDRMANDLVDFMAKTL